MAIEVIRGTIGDDEDIVVLYYNNEGRAFGPRFEDADEAEEFLRWLPEHAPSLSHDELTRRVFEFRRLREEKANAEHEAKGGKFGIRHPTRYEFFGGFVVGGPARWDHQDDAYSFPTFAQAAEFRDSSGALRHCEIERLPL